MKKLLLLTIVMTCSVVTAHGQGKRYKHSPIYHKSGEIKFGLKLGINTPEIRYEDGYYPHGYHSHRLIHRQHADVFGEYKFTDEVGLQLALLYSGQGENLELDSDSPTKTKQPLAKINLDYIIVTLTLRFYPGAKRECCLFLGPYIGYLMSAVRHNYVDGKKTSSAIA